MRKEPLQIGFIGIGEQGWNNLLPAISLMSQVKLKSACDLVLSRAKAATQKFGADHHSTDYTQMLDAGELDAVVMAAPPQVHAEASRFFVERGIPVFVEKPPTVFTHELEALAGLAAERRVSTGIGLNFRFAEPVKLIRSVLAQDPADHPAYVSVRHISSKPQVPFWDLDSLTRSFLLAQVIHPLDTLLLFCGPVREIKSVSCHNEKGILASINFLFENGAIGHLETGTVLSHFETALEVITRGGRICHLDSLWNLTISDGDSPSIRHRDSRRWGHSWSPSPLTSGYSRTGYHQELEEFFACVIQDKCFAPSFQDALPLYQIMDTLEQQLGRCVE